MYFALFNINKIGFTIYFALFIYIGVLDILFQIYTNHVRDHINTFNREK